ncbi:MAG: N-acetyltransferase [Eubacteriales bacterium]|jgi:predicted N-acetyltransferase YhbS|nr:N-acetyltransferase [Eubacteriales bacterium]
MEKISIRLERPEDYREVENLTREAFWNNYVPGCDEHYLAHVLRESVCFLPELDFVAECSGQIVGNIMYTRASVLCDDGETLSVLSFGPLSVLPLWQGKGVGSALVRHSLERASELGFPAVLIYGDPAFYSRLGFLAAETFGIASADDYYFDVLQALELVAGALREKSGRFVEDHAYEVDEKAATAFDQSFPPKEKREGLPSQLRFLENVAMKKPRK